MRGLIAQSWNTKVPALESIAICVVAGPILYDEVSQKMLPDTPHNATNGESEHNCITEFSQRRPVADQRDEPRQNQEDIHTSTIPGVQAKTRAAQCPLNSLSVEPPYVEHQMKRVRQSAYSENYSSEEAHSATVQESGKADQQKLPMFEIRSAQENEGSFLSILPDAASQTSTTDGGRKPGNPLGARELSIPELLSAIPDFFDWQDISTTRSDDTWTTVSEDSYKKSHKSPRHQLLHAKFSQFKFRGTTGPTSLTSVFKLATKCMSEDMLNLMYLRSCEPAILSPDLINHWSNLAETIAASTADKSVKLMCDWLLLMVMMPRLLNLSKAAQNQIEAEAAGDQLQTKAWVFWKTLEDRLHSLLQKYEGLGEAIKTEVRQKQYLREVKGELEDGQKGWTIVELTLPSIFEQPEYEGFLEAVESFETRFPDRSSGWVSAQRLNSLRLLTTAANIAQAVENFTRE
eukprot:Blabericola_migrator_1__2737@NODE_1780_length_3808_cov_52_340551_g1146_i0_p2_GENE_NODE_1780_length_3808_cov_52_340551_g1146_i0NODE_1780_length_3808_cov_52_340551_g1146_i0_p2_ORF_typecomplete_len461_score53_00SEO_C/PF14577_6/0_059Hamartin/PF04388_12/0_042_NODE_1780_length_3808_cov_52_340551_g1146_i01251507